MKIIAKIIWKNLYSIFQHDKKYQLTIIFDRTELKVKLYHNML